MQTALFNLGFRPFFLFGSIYALLSILIWVLFYTGDLTYTFVLPTAAVWHGHEMIYGYAMAIAAGFLLTAVRNWTGVQTLHGRPLALLVLLWLAARILAWVPGLIPVALAVMDNLFLLSLAVALLLPIVRTGHWKSLAIVLKIFLIMASNIVFYLGVTGMITDGVRIGLYSGLYLIIALMLTLARRVIPFFIERGVVPPVTLVNHVWIDRSALFIFLFFWLAELIRPDSSWTALLAGSLFVIHSLRLSGWYTPGIWKQPMLWSLFFAYSFLILGFLLKVLVVLNGVSPFLALHAFTYGGIGMMTIGMMSRVTLGHTGRNVYQPSRLQFWLFVILLSGAMIRVLLPLLDNTHYLLWIKWSQLHWLIAFALFVFSYAPKLIAPRVDGKPG